MTLDALTLMALAGGVGYTIGRDNKPTVINLGDLVGDRTVFSETVTIDCSVARDLKEYNIAGVSMEIKNPTTPDVSVYCRFNHKKGEAFDLTAMRETHWPFGSFFITNSAGTGTLELEILKVPAMGMSYYDTLINVIGSEIMVPIDIQSSYVMMPIDIQAQYVTLDIDIVAQTVGNISVDVAAMTVGTIDVDITAQTVGNIGVDLKAQTVGNIDVDISAQTIGDLTISVSAQTVGISLSADWAAVQGDDFNLSGSDTTLAWQEEVTVNASADAEKPAYITGASCCLIAKNAADYDHFLYAGLRVYDSTADEVLARCGGLGGVFMTFTKPLVIPAGHSFGFIMQSAANLDCSGWVTGWGYD